MKRLLVLGLLLFGITALGLAQNGNGQGGNGNGQGGNGGPVQMVEGLPLELPLFLVGVASWALWRRHSRTRKNEDSGQVQRPLG
jgi:hypothetical protein